MLYPLPPTSYYGGMSSITNVWLPEGRKDELRAAIRHYHFESMAGFFRICGLALIEHHKRKDAIMMPFRFTIDDGKPLITPKKSKRIFPD